MYDNYLFVLIYGLFVCMYVCMYMSKQGRRVIFIVYANKDIVSVICMYVH